MPLAVRRGGVTIVPSAVRWKQTDHCALCPWQCVGRQMVIVPLTCEDMSTPVCLAIENIARIVLAVTICVQAMFIQNFEQH